MFCKKCSNNVVGVGLDACPICGEAFKHAPNPDQAPVIVSAEVEQTHDLSEGNEPREVNQAHDGHDINEASGDKQAHEIPDINDNSQASDQVKATNQTYHVPPIPSAGQLNPLAGKWSWGAFGLTCFWGIGHDCYKTLLALIPVFGLVWTFVCGFHGNTWAWEKNTTMTAQEFVKSQESWKKAGIAGFIVNVLFTLWIISHIVQLVKLFLMTVSYSYFY